MERLNWGKDIPLFMPLPFITGTAFIGYIEREITGLIEQVDSQVKGE
jgi:hypothetical protein